MNSIVSFEKPRFELADIVRLYGDDHRRTHVLSPLQSTVPNALANCRTAVLGGHLERCDKCGHETPTYNACRNRCCPKCQGMNNVRRVQDREAELLPVQYFHYLFKVENLGTVYRGKFCDKLLKASGRGEITNPPDSLIAKDRESLRDFIDHLHGKPWVVYSKVPFAGPEAVLKYLSRYTHRTAIGNRRLQSIDNGEITFTRKDYHNDGEEKLLTLSADGFLRRFLLHVPPKGFVRIRHHGILAGRDRTAKPGRCRALCGLSRQEPKKRLSAPELLRELTGHDPKQCPHCGKGRLTPVLSFPNRLPVRGPPALPKAA